MPDITELNELLTALEALTVRWDMMLAIEHSDPAYSAREQCMEELEEVLDQTWIRAWLDE